jgi:DNA-binding NtrC family response regulator
MAYTLEALSRVYSTGRRTMYETRENLQRKTILLIDDDPDMHTICRRYVENAGYSFMSAHDGRRGLEIMRQGVADLVLLDFMMPEKDGYAVYKEFSTLDDYAHVRNVPVIMLSVLAERIAKKDELLNMGVSLYLNKPFGYKELVNVIDNIFVTAKLREEQRSREKRQQDEVKRIQRENLNLRSQIQEAFAHDNIISLNPMMRAVLEKVVKVAPSDANILIHGESGTGKELIARSIHAHSRRVKGPFVAVDCVALPSTLLESELFGYQKGAFTGASQSKMGLFEMAHEGTFFLDEICELHPDLQAKLLRVLQERQFRPLGGKKLIDVDIRVISATNRDPRAAVKEGILRHDLYYRLNVIPIHLIPMRERREDIPPLANFFLKKFCKQNEHPLMRLSPEAMELLVQYDWPGNVRELQNVIERVVSLSNSEIIRPGDLPEVIHEKNDSLNDEMEITNATLREARQRWTEKFERRYLTDLLAKHNGNISQVARSAGVNRMTIYRLLKQHDISLKIFVEKSA